MSKRRARLPQPNPCQFQPSSFFPFSHLTRVSRVTAASSPIPLHPPPSRVKATSTARPRSHPALQHHGQRHSPAAAAPVGAPGPTNPPRFWTPGAQHSPCPVEPHLKPRPPGCPPLSPPFPRVFFCSLLRLGATQLLPSHTSSSSCILLWQRDMDFPSMQGCAHQLHSPCTKHWKLHICFLFFVNASTRARSSSDPACQCLPFS